MTRFARAKGSKASNEKLPEKPTSWSIMKQQLLEKTNSVEDKRKYLEVKNQRNASYQKFLAEKEEEESKNVKWADFPGANLTKSNKKKAGVTKKKSKPILSSEASFDESDDEEFNELKAKIDKALEEQEANSESDAPEEHSSKNEVMPPEVAKTKKVKAKKLKIVSYKESKVILKKDQDAKAIEHEKKSKIPGGKNTGNNKNAQKSTESENNLSELDLKKKEKKLERRRKQVEKKKAIKLQMKAEKMNKKDGDKKGEVNQQSTNKPDPSEEELKKMEKKKEKKLKQLERRKLKKKLLKEQKEAEQKVAENDVDKRQNRCETDDPLITSNLEPKLKNNFNKGNKGIEKINKEHNSNQGNYNKKTFTSNNEEPHEQDSRPKKRKDKSSDKEPQRKKPYLPDKMWINGEQVEIGYVDGFPIMKKDSERLKQLKKEMIMKGLPGSEIKAALKLERRRAEKALAREKKKVCFNCRKSGHNLSECPELGKDQLVATTGSGICFKCGSTEHSHLDCKVVKGQSFNYAQCFICNEQGHIARQCPDNPKGLYPKGGGCNVCGDVSHLKKDCPSYQEQQQKQNDTFKLGTLGTSNPDADDYDSTHKVQNVNNNNRPNKIIKF